MDKTIYINGKIFTSDESNPFVKAMCVENGKILWCGDDEKVIASFADEKIDVVDLEGKCVIPGLVDSHMHPVTLAEFMAQIPCLPPETNSIEEMVEKIREVSDKSEESQWILGWGYDEGKFAEKRSPNRYDLDRGCKDKPVSIIRCCEHIRCVNSKALEMAGIDENALDPEGGEIERDEDGVPTGVLKETARNLVLPFMPLETEEDKINNLLALGKLLDSQGIVAIADMGNFYEGDNLGIFEEAGRRGFNQRVSVYYMWEFCSDKENFTVPAESLSPESKFHVGGLKLVADGSVSGRTAWMHEPYLDGTPEDIGLCVYSEDEMESAIKAAKKLGCQVSVHTMGGRAIDKVLDRIESEKKWTTGSTPHVRIEHVTEPSTEALDRIKKLQVGVATQPIFMYCEIESYIKNLEAERIKKAYPVRTMMEKGIQVSLSTDAPATAWAIPSDPFSNIESAVTRTAYDGTDLGKGEAISVEDAIRLYTIEGARNMGLAGVGKIEEGYLGNFAILDRDIFEIPPEDIHNVKVLGTYIEGEKVYER